MNDASEVVVGANGKVWVAATDNLTPPDDVGTAMDESEWTDLGYVTEEGVKPTFGKEISPVGAWQSFYDIRKLVTSRTAMVAFALRQWNRANVEFALEATVEDNSGEYTVRPNSPEDLDERSLVVEWQDGDKNYRLYFPNGIVTENVETSLVRTDSAQLPITFAVNDPGTDPLSSTGESLDAWLLFTDDPAFAEVSS